MTSSGDVNGDITTTVDLLGRTTTYSDIFDDTTTYTYDSLGRLTTKASDLGTEAFVYDNYNRLTQQKLDGTVLATPTYDTYGRLATVAYTNAASMSLSISRDSLGRTSGQDYTLGNGTTHVTDTVSRSQSGQITSGTENGQAKTYSYDNADRLVSGSDPNVDQVTYDARGNTTSLGTSYNAKHTDIFYDSSDRNTGFWQNWLKGSSMSHSQNWPLMRVGSFIIINSTRDNTILVCGRQVRRIV